MGQTITNITTKVRVDSMKNAYGVMDGATDYVSADSNKFFHVVILASFAPDFNGKLRLEISHPKSGFRTYEIVNNPPRQMLKTLEADDKLCFGSPGIRVERLLGQNYKLSSEEADYINVKLYLNNETVVTKDFAIRGMFS